MSLPTDDVIIRREGRAGRITLNRPKALNALTYPMVLEIEQALLAWRDDAQIAVVILDGAGDRGLCAGGDVRSLYDRRADGVGFAAHFWRDEYRVNAMIHRYDKPFVAIMDGIVMGGGIGLSAHARHRVVTEKSQLAMPETTIGLIPDVGGTWLLAHAPGGLGAYLGLTGARMSGADAIQAGFAQSFVPSSKLADLVAALAAPGGASAESIVEDAEETVPASSLAAEKPKLDRWFAFDTVEGIIDALSRTTDPLAMKAKADLATRSPLALKLTLAAIRRAKARPSLEAALAAEYRVCTRLYAHGEFLEGIRALLVDKDKLPKWNPPDLAGVTDAMIESYFEPLGADEERFWMGRERGR